MYLAKALSQYVPPPSFLQVRGKMMNCKGKAETVGTWGLECVECLNIIFLFQTEEVTMTMY